MAEGSAGTAIQKIIFDTDVLIWYLRGNDKARRFLEHVPLPQRAISSLTLMELLQGCRNQSEAQQVKAFVANNIPLVLYPDEFVFRRAIDLLEQYAFAHGLRVVDALITATALEEGLSLATANVKHFRAIARLPLIPFRL
jgi:predicted nucleic acid-binding protein